MMEEEGEKPYEYTADRHRAAFVRKFPTLQEAVAAALDDMDADQAWPVSISGPSGPMWEQDGPFRTRESLERMKEEGMKEKGKVERGNGEVKSGRNEDRGMRKGGTAKVAKDAEIEEAVRHDAEEWEEAAKDAEIEIEEAVRHDAEVWEEAGRERDEERS